MGGSLSACRSESRRFAEKQYTRRLVGLGNSWEASCAPNGGRCVRSDSLGIWRDSEGRGWRGGKTHVESPLRLQRCDTCHPGAGAQGPNRHGSCTQPLPSRRQGLERNLPSLAAEPQLLPGPPGSLVLSANLQVLCGCLPTCSSRSLWGFSGHPSGVVTRPSAWCIKQPVLRTFTRGTDAGKRTLSRTGQEYQGLLPGLT